MNQPKECFFKAELFFDSLQRRDLWRLIAMDKDGNALSGGDINGYKCVDCFYVNPVHMVKAQYLLRDDEGKLVKQEKL